MDLHPQVVRQEPRGHRQQLATLLQHLIPAAMCLLKRISITITIKAKSKKQKKQKNSLEILWLQTGLK
jgi:hypothetical protein